MVIQLLGYISIGGTLKTSVFVGRQFVYKTALGRLGRGHA